jgi:hypothetical protein
MAHIAVRVSTSAGGRRLLGQTLILVSGYICLRQAMDPRVVTRLVQQFVNAESIQKGGHLFLLVDRL